MIEEARTRSETTKSTMPALDRLSKNRLHVKYLRKHFGQYAQTGHLVHSRVDSGHHVKNQKRKMSRARRGQQFGGFENNQKRNHASEETKTGDQNPTSGGPMAMKSHIIARKRPTSGAKEKHLGAEVEEKLP